MITLTDNGLYVSVNNGTTTENWFKTTSRPSYQNGRVALIQYAALDKQIEGENLADNLAYVLPTRHTEFGLDYTQVSSPSVASNNELFAWLNRSFNQSNGGVNYGLTAQGTTQSTTSIMSYGTNVFTTITQTNYCTKLPQPITGMIVSVVNLTTFSLVVYPSNIGGTINNLPPNTPIIIPPNGNTYLFTCILNPLVGAWTVSMPATTQFDTGELTVSHTQGVDTNSYGITQAGLSSTSGAGVSWTGSVYVLNLTGEFVSIPSPATATTLKCYTNIVAADENGTPPYSHFTVAYIQARLITSNGSTIGQLISIGGLASDWSLTPIGTLSSPPLIGDTDTYYGIQPIIGLPINSNQIGTMITGEFSNNYFQFGIFIEAAAATKVYKFRFFIEYF